MSRAITGKDDHLLDYLAKAINRAVGIRFNVAFLMESGTRLITPYLEEAADRGVATRVLTGRYMSITEPSAIYYLLGSLGDRVDIRFYAEQVRSFHPKAYIFEYEDDAEIFIGSSNLSRSALTFGLEWNYSILRSNHPRAYDKFSQSFEELFHYNAQIVDHEVLKKYTAGWKKPRYIKIEESFEAEQLDDQVVFPRGVQVEALYEPGGIPPGPLRFGRLRKGAIFLCE